MANENITNEKLLKVLQNNDRMLYGSLKGMVLKKSDYHGCCTSGPTGWYAQAGISLGWWSGTYPVTYDNSNTRLKNCGMVPVWHGTLEQINSLTDANLRPGDIGTLYTGSGEHQHGMMWTGHDWRSDCIQNRASCYSSSNQGEWSAVLWRHPDLQQKEWGDIKDMNSAVGSVDFTGSGSYNGGGGGTSGGLGTDGALYTNGNGSFSGSAWGTPIEGDVSQLYKLNTNKNSNTPGVVIGTHMRQKV